MGRGSSKLSAVGRGTVPAPAPAAEPVLTDEQMQKELDEHFAKVNAILDKFMAAKTGTVLEDFNDDPELDLPRIEKETIK